LKFEPTLATAASKRYRTTKEVAGVLEKSAETKLEKVGELELAILR